MTFPEDPRSSVAWDAFWKHLIDNQGNLRPIRFDEAAEPHRRLLGDLIRQQLNRVLFAGNGICVLPHIFAECGFSATAVDIAPTATRYAQANPPDERMYLHFFMESSMRMDRTTGTEARFFDPELSREAYANALRPNGKVKFVSYDLFQLSAKPQYDAIVVQNLIEHFTPTDRRVLAKNLFDGLAPGGVAYIESQGLSVVDPVGETADGIESVFEDVGFKFHLKDLYVWRQNQLRYRPWSIARNLRFQSIARAVSDEFERRALERRKADLEDLAAGTKLAIFEFGR